MLVVRTLDPRSPPLLPGLTGRPGLVAQTGSRSSHLAFLAREFGLPAVVGATDDAARHFPPRSRLTAPVPGSPPPSRLTAWWPLRGA
ncbi:hypothetical protein AQJ67_14650 [Streptomyces caeruleatus]|uniref:PEP-utilising enzyme mobile domain-containing protein n=1 Tax=Streptomyces caeruleatus TaxID=661399 RepID=A0A101U4C0_9ACTN|nr:hypothetical protein AQJ67_14650 [Streptomyces caeruleatus]